VNKALSRTNGLSEVMERQKNQKVQELEELELDAAIAKRKKELQDQLPPAVPSVQATNIASTLFAGRRPEEIKQILSTLTPDEIDRLAYIASSNNQNNLRGLIQAPGSNIKEVIEIVKLVSELRNPKNQNNGGNDVAEMAKALTDAMKLGLEMSKAQQPQPVNPQNDFQYKMVENTLAELKATREQMANQDRLKLEREIEALKNRPSAVDEIAASVEKMQQYRKVFGGNDSSATNEYTLKKTELEQTERLETKKLDWEMQKWEKEKDADTQKYNLVKTVLEGPVGDVLKSLGNAGASRVRGNGNASQATQTTQNPNIVCPNPKCNRPFYADPVAQQVTCPHCNAVLEKQSPQPTPSPEPQPQTQETATVTEPNVEQPAPVSDVVGTAH
jgi:hypothetical protein